MKQIPISGQACHRHFQLACKAVMQNGIILVHDTQIGWECSAAIKSQEHIPDTS